MPAYVVPELALDFAPVSADEDERALDAVSSSGWPIPAFRS